MFIAYKRYELLEKQQIRSNPMDGYLKKPGTANKYHIIKYGGYVCLKDVW